MALVYVPPARLPRWLENFAASHGEPTLAVESAGLCGVAPDGSTFEARLPFGRAYDGPAVAERFLAQAEPPHAWGILLVRKGGFAVARMSGATITEHKVGQRHVQGRSKAGGWSQQRFARRREQQARAAYDAAGDHAHRILTGGLEVLVTGGDRTALEAVLAESELARLPRDPHVLEVHEPRRAELDRAIERACSVRMSVTNA